VQAIRIAIVGRVVAYFSLLAACIAFTRIYVAKSLFLLSPLPSFLFLSPEFSLRLSFFTFPYLVSFLCSLTYLFMSHESRNSTAGIAMGYGLDGRGMWVRFPEKIRDFSHLHSVQTGSETHPVSYTIYRRSWFSGAKVAGA
jgi:hypothetical protein